MDVSIIIVNYKTPNLVVDCVNSIREKTKDLNYEIIIVDNDSQDQSFEIINNQLKDYITYIQSDTNLGFGKANNLGVSYAKGDYVFLLNSDTLLINNAIKILYDYISTHKDVGIVGGNLYNFDNSEASSFSMSFDDLYSLKKNSSFLSLLILKIKQNIGIKSKPIITFNKTNVPMKVGYIYGTDLMIKKSLYDKINGFDPDFFMYAEEEELSYRVVEKGYSIWSIPDAKIIHFDGASSKSTDEFNPRHFKMRIHGGMLYYKKRYINGLDLYYKYRMKRINNSILIAKMAYKDSTIKILNIQKDCLQKVYEGIKNGEEKPWLK